MTDDQTFSSFGPEAMPKTWRLFHDDRSAVFERAVASPPLCCPARAGLITGQYPHNHGVLGNVPGYADLTDKPNVLPAWLDQAGYRTAMVGKYLNEYEQVGGEEPAPGWDSWNAVFGYPAYFDYTLNANGNVDTVGSDPGDYSTTRFTDIALEELNDGGRKAPVRAGSPTTHPTSPRRAPRRATVSFRSRPAKRPTRSSPRRSSRRTRASTRPTARTSPGRWRDTAP